MALLGFGYWSLVGLTAGTALGNCVLAWLFSDWRPGWPKRRSGIRPMLTFGGGLTIANIFHHLGRSADSILIGRFLGASSVGLYSKAYGLVLLPTQQLLAPMGAVLLPALSRLANDPTRFRSAAMSALRLIAMLTVPTVAVMIVVADWIVLVVLGPNWTEASQLFRVFCLSAMLSPLNSVLSLILTALGQTRSILKWSIVNNVLVVISIAVGLRWGLMGVAFSFTITGLLLRVPYFYWVVSKVSPLSIGDFCRTTLPYLGTAGAAVAILLSLRTAVGAISPWIGLPLFLIGGLLVYLLLLLVFRFGRRDLQGLINLRHAWRLT
jgi:PST family polysaccharide transporter